jgi:hypothetical protein
MQPLQTLPQPVQPAVQAPAQNGLPDSHSILSTVTRNILNKASGAVDAVQNGIGNVVDAAVGNKPTIVNNTPTPQVQEYQQLGKNFTAKFKNPPMSVLSIEPAIGRAAKSFDVPTDALYYTLVSENAPAVPNPKSADPNDQGMFQVNKVNEPLVASTLKREFGIDYNPANPNHSALAAAVVLHDASTTLSKYGMKNLSPQDLSVAYRMGPTNYSIATRGTDLNGNKAKPDQALAAKQEYDARVADLNQNHHDLSTSTADAIPQQ